MTPTVVYLVSPYGGVIQLTYTWTFDELAITCVLCALTVLFATSWVYEVTLQLWQNNRREDAP